MKKVSYAILVIIIVALLALYYQKSVKKLPAEKERVTEEVAVTEPPEGVVVKDIYKYIPSGGSLYINFSNLKTVYESIKETTSFKQFVALKMFYQLKKDIDEFNKVSSFKISFDNTLKIIGNDMFLSLYAIDGKDEPDILISTLLDDSASYVAKFSTFIIQTLQVKNNKAEIGKELYNDIDINYVIDKDKRDKIYYVIIDNYAHMSSDIDILKNVIDLTQGSSGKSINTSAKYLKALENFRPKRFFSFFYDFKSTEKLEELLEKRFGENSVDFKNNMPTIENYDIIYADAIANKGIDIAGKLTVSDAAPDDYVKYLSELLLEKKEGEFIKSVKSAPLFYGSNNGVSIAKYYENVISKEAEKPSVLKMLESKFNEITKMSLYNDVVPLLGDEIIYSGTDIDVVSSFIPLPKLYIAFKIKDSKKFAELYDKVNVALNNPENNIRLKDDEHGGVKYKFTLTPFGIAPGHAIVSDYYIIFSNPECVNSLIDGIASNDAPYFDSVGASASGIIYDEYNYYSYFGMGTILSYLPDLYDKYSATLQSSMNKDERREFLRKYNEEVIPFVEFLKVMKYVVWNSYYDKESRVHLFKSHLLMEEGK